MNKKRLLKLADFLETVPRKAFDIDTWEARAQSKPEGERPGECGFAGCAVGWAAHAKLFSGFRMSNGDPVYAGAYGWDAVLAVFEMPRDSNPFGNEDAEDLFYGGSYENGNPTPKQVAKKIRQFVSSTSEA